MKLDLFGVKNFKIAFVEHDTPIAGAYVFVNAGSSDEKPNQWGVAHFLEHMFFKGTQKRDYRQINNELAKLGRANAFTGNSLTGFYVNFFSKDLDNAIETLMELTFQPALLSEEMDKERGVIQEECKTRLDNPNAYFFDQSFWHLFGDQRGHPTIGTPQSIDAITLDHLQSFIDLNYTPDNILIVIVGKTNKETIQASLEQNLPDIPSGKKISHPSAEWNWENHSFTFHSKQTTLAFIFPGITLEESFEAQWADDVLCNALGGGMHSILFNRIREELGLCYSISLTPIYQNERDGLVLLRTLIDESNVDLVTEEIDKILKDVRKNGLDENILEIAKTNELFSMANNQTEVNGIASVVSNLFRLKNISISDFIDIEKRINTIETLTNDDVCKMANKLFGPQQEMKVCKMSEGK